MKSLILIDVAGIYHAAWHSSRDLEFGEAFERTIRKVHQLAQGYDHCVVTYDWGPYKRLKISSEYKANREKQSDVFYDQYRRVRERLTKDGFCVMGSEGYESDDVIGTIVDKLRGKYVIRIASADKDLAQLVCDADQISLVSHMTGNVLTDDTVREKFGVNPADIRDFLALTGDTADNVPGVKGIGPTIAAKIINSPEGFTGALNGEEIEGLTPRIRKLLKDNVMNVKISRKLVTLMTDVPIDIEEIFKERKPQSLPESSIKFEEDSMQSKVTDAEFTDDALGALFGSETAQTTQEVLTEKVSVPVSPSGPAKIPDLQVPQAPTQQVKQSKPETALAKVVTVSFEDELQPRSLANADFLANKLVSSRLYTNFANQEATLGIIMAGREMGLRAMESLRAFHMVEGKPTMHAHLIIARAKQHPDCEYFQMIESDGTKATYETKNKRNPKPTRLTYTIEQARQAGLAPLEGDTSKKGNWSKRPDEMLRKTCAVQLARIEYPDAAMGLYSPEEMGDQNV